MLTKQVGLRLLNESIDPDAAGDGSLSLSLMMLGSRASGSGHGSSDKFLSEKALDFASRSNRKSDSCADETEHLREL